MKRISIALVTLALFALLGVASPISVTSVAAAPASNPTNADCQGSNTSMLNRYGWHGQDVVNLIENDGDPNTNVSSPGDFHQQLRDGGWVSGNFDSGGYLEGCTVK